MLIKCENCSVVYEVPDERLAFEHPHFFKCSACGNVFAVPNLAENKEQTEENESLDDVFDVIPTEEVEVPEEVPQVEQSDAVPMPLSDIFNQDESEAENAPEKSDSDVNLFEPLETAEEFNPVTPNLIKNRSFFKFLLSFCVAFVSILLLFYVGRYFFVRKAPITEKVYQTVGIKTDILGEGLAFRDTSFDIQENGKNYELLIKSQVVNTTDGAKKVPTIVIILFDGADNALQKQHIFTGDAVLEAGQSYPIKTVLKSLPESSKRIEITFERND